jgi:hypothetical protein
MDDNDVNKPSAFFEIQDLYEQAEELGLRRRVPAQRKLDLSERGLGLRLSTGTQEPVKKTKSRGVKSSPKVVKHTIASLRKHVQEFKASQKEDDDENERAGNENKEPTTNDNKILTEPLVVDLMTQENRSVESPSENEESTATVIVGMGEWSTSRDDRWTRVFQARSTEGGMDFYVDTEALGEVAGSLLRDLTTQRSAY